MKRWQLTLITTCAVFCMLAGCKKNAEPTAQTEEYQPLNALDTAAAAGPVTYETDPYVTDPLVPRGTAYPSPGITTAPPDAGSAPADATPGARYHVVQKGDTLYKIARTYYNDQRRWKDIWNANKSLIPDKDKLLVGQRLVIP